MSPIIQPNSSQSAEIENLQLALRAANVGLWEWDLQSDEVCFARERRGQTGDAEDSLVNEGRSCVHPDDLPGVRQSVRDFTANPSSGYQHEFRLQHRDGSYHWILAQGSLLADPQGKPRRLLGAYMDITGRKTAEETVHQSRDHLRCLLEAQPECVKVVGRDGQLLEINPAGLMFLEAGSLTEARQQPLIEFVQPPYRAAFEELHQRVMDGASGTLEFEARGLRGTRRWLETIAVPLRDAGRQVQTLLAVTRDITAHKQNLEQSVATLHRAQMVAHIGSWHLDVFRNILTWTAETYRIFGVPPGTPLSYDVFLACVHPDDRSRVNHSWQAACSMGAPYDLEHRIVMDGTVKWVHEQATLEFDDQGRLAGGVGTVQDITERKRIEQRSATLAALADQLNATDNPNAAARVIAATADQIFGWDACTLDLYDDAADQLTSVLNMDLVAGQRQDVPVARASLSPTLRQRHIIERGGELILRQPPLVFEAEAVPFGDVSRPSASILLVPIWDRRRVIGLLSIQSYQLQAYTRTDLDMLQALANHCGEALSRMRISEALRRAEAKYRSIFENAVDGIFQTTPDGRFLTVNAAMARMLGYGSPGEMMTERTDIARQGYVRPEEREEFKRHLERDGSVTGFEYECFRKDGTRVWLSESARAVRDAAGGIICYEGTVEDITERKATQETLRVSEEKFENLFESSPDAIIVAARAGGIRAINRQTEHLFGYGREDLLGQPIEVLMPQRFRRGHVGQRESYMSNPHVRPMGGERDLWARRKDGSEFPADISLSPITTPEGMMTICTVRDVTTRKLAETQIRKLAAFPELNPNPVLELSATGAVSYCNRPAHEMARQLSGGEVTHLLPLDIKAIVEGCLATGQPRLRLETRHGPSTLSWSFYPIMDQQTVHCYVGDISERLKLEAQLRQSQKMEAVGQLAGGIAHDFNNILGAIIGNVELARLTPLENASLKENLDVIYKSSRRAADLIKQILTFSRQQEQQRQPMQMHLIVREALKLLRSTVPTSIEFQTSLASTSMVLGDPSQIHQVVMNLCTNAWHAMQDRPGVIRVEMSETERDADLARTHPDLRPGRYVRLTVADTGQGMNSAVLEHIFEPFFTTKPVGMGTGLGLAVVHGIIKQHDGSIAVRSQPGEGTVFELCFPVLDTADAERVPASAQSARHGHGERILLVDDEEALASLGKIILERLNYRPIVAVNPTAALLLFREQPEAFDLVIADFNMPGMNGTAFARKVWEIRPDARVVLATGYSATLTAEDARALGFRELLPKPYDMRSLGESIRRALA